MKLSRLHRTLIALLGVAMAASSCSSDPSRGDVLAQVGANDIVPMYVQLEQNAAMLASATGDVCNSGGAATLADAQAALAATRTSWSRTEAAWIGPVMDRRSWAVIDWPINRDEIDELIASDVELDVERLGKAIGADQRGLGAIEYMLGEPGAAANDAAQFNARRCQYIVGIAQVIHNETQLLLADWTTGADGQGPYAERLAAEGSDALDSLINDSLFLLEDIGDRELGSALGAMGSGADLERILEGPAGLATNDIAAHVAGLRSVLVGDGSDEGLRPLLGDEISNRLNAQFEVAEGAVAAVGSPLRSAVANDPERVEALRQAVKDIQVTVATEVVSRLGVTIGFSDADGDTGA